MAKFGASISFGGNSTKDIKFGEKDSTNIFELEQMFLNLQVPQRTNNLHRGKLYGSQAGVCPRKNVINSFLETDATLSLSGSFYTSSGDCLEKNWIELLDYNDKLIANSVKLADNPNFIKESEATNCLLYGMDEYLGYSGILDFVVLHDSKVWLLDSKVCGELPEKNSYNYERQVQFYSAVTGIDNSALLYLSRNIRKDFNRELDIAVLKVDCSHEKLLDVMTVAFLSKLCVDNEILPNKTQFFKKTVHCKNCSFVDFCYNDGDLELYPLVQDEELLVKLEKEAEELAVKFMKTRKSRFFQFYEKFLKEI